MRQIASLVICAFCTAHAGPKQPKLHYDDCVKVTSGFYKDCVGLVKGVYSPDSGSTTYEVNLTCKADATVQDIEENNLQLQKDEACK
jgi:hypothetical protein